MSRVSGIGGFGMLALAFGLGGMASARDDDEETWRRRQGAKGTPVPEPDAMPRDWHNTGEPDLCTGSQPFMSNDLVHGRTKTQAEREAAVDDAAERRLRRAFMADVDQRIRAERGNRKATKEAPVMRRTLHELVRRAVLVEMDDREPRRRLETVFAYTNHRGERRGRIVALDHVRWGLSEWHPGNGSAWFLQALDVEREDEPLRDFDIAMIERL